MRVVPRLIALVVILSLAACGGGGGGTASPTAPSATVGTSTPGTSPVLSLRLQDVFNASPVGGTVRLANGSSATASSSGMAELSSASGQFAATVSGDGFVTRETNLRVPASATTLSMIPSTFDLAAFDTMCRGAGILRRWESAPALVVVDAVLQFTSSTADTAVATGERMSAAERESLVADLAWGLPELSGGGLNAFRSVTTESPSAGSTVTLFPRDGIIVVARFAGLRSTGYAGFGRWGSRGDTVVSGAVLLDRDVDAAGGPHQRSLRVHELGHALGWAHLESRTSVMNSVAIVLPTEFDHAAFGLAFQRSPGSRSPDADPSAYCANLLALPLVAGPAIH
jgi:hypothetical protein